MNPRAIAMLLAAVALGLAFGYLVTNDFLPWQVPIALLIGAVVTAVWFIREQVQDAVAAQAAARWARKAKRGMA